MNGVTQVFPAHAGMSPTTGKAVRDLRGFPRPRGDEPLLVRQAWERHKFSPPTRG